MNKTRRLLWLSAVTCLLSACTENVFVHSYRAISVEGWRRSDTLVFPLPPSPGTLYGRSYVEIRFDNSFPYEELWLEVETRTGSVSRRDTIQCALGERNGTGFNLSQYEHPLGEIILRENEEASIRIHHLMERETIPHLQEVGIRVEKALRESAPLPVPARINTQEDEQQNGEAPE